MRERIYFLRITPLNWLLALFLSFRYDVWFWRSTLPLWSLWRFRRFDVENRVTRDQWLLMNDDAFEVWRDEVYPCLRNRYQLVNTYLGTRIDYSTLLIQHLSLEFERLYQLCRVIELSGDSGQRIIEPWITRCFTPALMNRILGKCVLAGSRLHRLCEGAYEWTTPGGHLLRLTHAVLRRFFSSHVTLGSGPVLWTGISPQEIPEQAGRLDFAWPVRYAGLSAERVVFLLPVAMSEKQKKYFSDLGAVALGPLEITRLVTIQDACRAFFRTVTEVLRSFFADESCISPLRALFIIRSYIWINIAKAIQPSRYFTTTSYCWPERPEVAALAALSVPATIWSYSSNSLAFSHDAPQFEDKGVSRTIFVARDFWVWNEAYRKWMMRRQVGTGDQIPTFSVMGSLMCGDARWLAVDKATAKKRLNLDPESFYLAIFDVPEATIAHRRTFYGGPRMFVDGFHDAFHDALIELLEQLPTLRILIKLKRPTSSQWHNFPASLLKLIDRAGEYCRTGRVAVLHQDTDPYLPIAACDAALGVPYTSPVLTAVSQGKPAAFFDPMGLTTYPSERAYSMVTIPSPALLLEVVSRWTTGKEGAAVTGVESLMPPLTWDLLDKY